TGASHDTPGVVNGSRNYDAIARAGATARDAVWQSNLNGIADAIRQSYAVQRAEGMDALAANIPGAIAWKYCGGGFGGYALYLFTEPAQRAAACQRSGFRPIEPHVAAR